MLSHTSDVFTTMEPPTTLNDDHVVSWETPNFGFEKTFEDECSGIVSVAWNEGLYVDGNNEVQFGGSAQYPGVRRQWLRYTDTVSEKRQKASLLLPFASNEISDSFRYSRHFVGQSAATGQV